jgi:alcohol dehydrogenase class IV
MSTDTTRAVSTDLRHATPAFRTFGGAQALQALPRELARVGASRAVIICSPSVEPHTGPLNEILGDVLVGRFDHVVEHSPIPAVEKARDVLAEHRADAVIAVGGGSAVVTARAATILLAEASDLRDLCTRREGGRLVSPKLTATKLPQWVVPSTPTTAYAKAGAAVRDPQTGERLALFDPKARAQGVVLDPAMALTAPSRLTWSAALNAFSMAVEGLTSRVDDPLADALHAQALRMIAAWLPRVAKEPDEAAPRLQLMLAALQSGQGSDYTGGGLAQALAHAVGPRSDVANGVVEALLLPHAVRFNAEVVPGRLTGLADLLGLPDGQPATVVSELERLLAEFEVPARLRDVGVTEHGLDEAVTHALDDWAITASPRVPDDEQIRTLLQSVR